MIRTVFRDSSPFFKIIFSGFIMVVSFIFVFILGIVIAMPFIDISIAQIPEIYNDLSNDFNINLLKYIQGLNTIGLFIIPPFIIAIFMGEKAVNYLNLDKIGKSSSIVYAILAMLISLPLINFLAEINSQVKFPDSLVDFENMLRRAEENAQYITEFFVNVNSLSGYFVNIVIIALLPAIGEELIFRGVFQRFLIKWTKNIHLGIILSAILFSAFHFQFYGFLPRMLMGVFFGYLLVWTNSIWIPIIVHFVNNATAVTFYYLYNIKLVNIDIENIGADKEMFIVVILSTAIVSGLIYAVYKNEKGLRVKNV